MKKLLHNSFKIQSAILSQYKGNCMYNGINYKRGLFNDNFKSLSTDRSSYSNLNCKNNSFYSIHKKHFNQVVNFNQIDDNDLISIPMSRIRNFCIIAHIDHGKSTLSDRILETCGVIKKLNKENYQILDNLQVEKERGITVKAQTASMLFTYNNEKYLLNLIDTPGHVDFSFEVIRSLKPCQGAILLVDATKGVQAQTVANYNHAKSLGIKIMPVINKIDLQGADALDTEIQIKENFKDEFKDNLDANILKISAKTGINIDELMGDIITKLPHPEGDEEAPLKALLYDAKFVETKGVVLYIEVLNGVIKKGDVINSYHTDKSYDIFEVGVVQPSMTKTSILKSGQVGYIISNLKEIKEAKIGDTLFSKSIKKDKVIPVSDYSEPKSMVFSGIYPTDPSDYVELKKAIEKMCLTDSSLKVEQEMSASLGAGFRVGFLGLLHLDVFHQRLEDEYDMDAIITAPSTTYRVKVRDNLKHIEITYPNVRISNKDLYEKKRLLLVENVISCPDREAIEYIEEPFIEAEIITPKEHYSNITNLVLMKRGEELLFEEQGENLVKIVYELPLNEVVVDFYDKLKSISKGYASFDYKFSEYRVSDVKIVTFLIHGEKVDALGFFAHASNAETDARRMVMKLKKHIPQQLFAFPIQAKVENKIICREDVKALRKNVTAKCYGGDMTRRMKLLDKQKKGKKKMRDIGTVKFSSETFYNILKDKSDE